MIGRLRGELVYKQPPALMVEVGGVGYELEAPMSTCFALPAVGEPVTLWTHLQVREDAHTLYGFSDETQRSLFRALLKVSGVGARMALAILSGMSPEEFHRCVAEGNVKALTRLPGIGKKTAERLVVEMRDRLDRLFGEAPAALSAGEAAAAVPAPGGPREEAVQALEALGYRSAEAEKLVRAVAADGMDSQSIIRAALRASLK